MSPTSSKPTDPRSAESKRQRGHAKIRNAGRIRKKEITPFTQRLAAMLDAGLPLVQSLDALVEQTDEESFANILTDIRERIESGDSLAEALSGYRKLFGDLYISMIQAGEMSGSLSEVTARIGQYMESSAAIRRRIVSAMTYPVMVLGLSLVITSALILFIVPKFADMYDDFGAELPQATKLLLKTSDFARGNAFLMLGIIAAVVYSAKFIRNTDKGGYIWDRALLQMPIAGTIIYKITVGRMARMFASLTRSGVGILDTFDIVSQGTGNRYLSKAVVRAQHDIEGGASIAQALRSTKVFPPMFIHMIGAGEKTGNVDGMLEKVADFYEEEVASTLESLSSMIEPLLMAFLGILIGGIAICMFLPIFNLGNVVN